MKITYILGALAALALTGCQPKPERYRIIPMQGSPFVIKIDTETGKSWKFESGVWTPIPTVPGE
jgi:hypothetical protein